MAEATTVTWEEISYHLQKNKSFIETVNQMKGTLALGTISVRDDKSLGIPGIFGLVIQYQDSGQAQFGDPPRTLVVPLPKEKLIDLARMVLRELDPTTDDLILKELRRLNERLNEDDEDDQEQ